MIYFVIVSLVGTIGNTIILYAYVPLFPGSTSTIFVIFLACVDLWTCLVVTPCIAIMEYNEFDISTFLCRFHIFSKIVIIISSLIMAAIAFDRIFIIINNAVWTMRLVKIILTLILCIALVLGILASLSFSSVSWSELSNLTETFNLSNSSEFVIHSHCYADTTIISDNIRQILKHISNKIFFICIGIVTILYTIIYILILKRQTIRLRVLRKNIDSLTRYDSTPVSSTSSKKQDDVYELINITRKSERKSNKQTFTTSDSRQQKTVSFNINKRDSRQKESSFVSCSNNFIYNDSCTLNTTSFLTKIDKSNTYTNSERLKQQLQKRRRKLIHITSAYLLITLSFIVLYLPSVLNAEQIITSPALVYYLYLCTHAVNPIIYCFTNRNLRFYVLSTLKCTKLPMTRNFDPTRTIH
ncbi:unnamed protein product [Didymodactylos carnosus]|uniref:G-protein coupled receptors family 1 profile domain-containing protein n=1 Tax=Didymodactylos carnosus TaxID=1234261 RepID=A0A8S2UAS0_9BILA|nr:unnamed protein product [Didymodactylos carnosus]CAF4334036.1 unnamed protein product [Didymodactylos carnosus]